MKFKFTPVEKPQNLSSSEWEKWTWQMQQSLKTQEDFSKWIHLTPNELQALHQGRAIFNFRVTPYYMSLLKNEPEEGPVRRMVLPSAEELSPGMQSMLDPLGERKAENQPVPRVIHRYSDRALFLVTDFCSVYCRYCTRKHFTGNEQLFVKNNEYQNALAYFRSHKGIREIILSGGDPLTLSDSILEKVLFDLRSIDHIEIIRIGSRMPVVCPMRITPELLSVLRAFKPVYLMTHFNHPKELTEEAAVALEKLVDHGVPVFNQMVLLNGVNNHPAIVQALSRRLLFLRVKPYYMFQCDPSQGTDHLRTSIEDSLQIQRELWGHLSGLAMPTLSVDIPQGGGKTYLVPNFETAKSQHGRAYKGWDGVEAEYINPPAQNLKRPQDVENYLQEWEDIRSSKNQC